VAFGDAFNPQPKSLKDAILKNCLFYITRASGGKPAGGWEKRGNDPLIHLNRNDKYFSQKIPHASTPHNVLNYLIQSKCSLFQQGIVFAYL